MGKAGRPIEGKNGTKANSTSISLYPIHFEKLEELKKEFNVRSFSDVIQKLIEDRISEKIELEVPKDERESDMIRYKRLFKNITSLEKSVTASVKIDAGKNFIQNNPMTKTLFPNLSLDEIYIELLKDKGD